MVSVIWSATGRIFCHFRLFFAHLPPKNPKNQNSEKRKRLSGDIITLHMCTINDNHMIYGSWDMERDKQYFLSFGTVFFFHLIHGAGCNCYFSFWAIFSPFTTLTAQTVKNFKKWKKHLELSSFYTCARKILNRQCTVPEIWCMTDRRIDRCTENVTHRGGCHT